MRLTLLLFAQCRKAAGRAELPLELPEAADLDALWDAAGRACPALLDLRPVTRVAVNREFTDAHVRLNPGDEVALIPPVSGG
jgi:molybdopterin converting factor subunit 1